MNDLISVIIPVYNTGQYLMRCVESVLCQDYEQIEIIIVDDGSSDDNTRLLCDSIAKKSPQIHVYHKENGGSANARNFGINKAKGTLIGFVDSDDVVEPNMFSSLYRDLKSHNVKIAIGNIDIKEKGRLVSIKKTIPSGIYYNKELLHFFFLGRWHSACTNLYKRDLFDNYLFPEGEINEDYMLNYLLFKDQEKIYYNDTVFYHYVKRESSNTSLPVSLAFLDWLNHTTIIRNDFLSHPSLKDEADYQYIYSNIILGNKSLLSLGKGRSDDAARLYKIVSDNLKRERGTILHNKYLSFKYRSFGVLLSFFPVIYKYLAIPIINVIR